MSERAQRHAHQEETVPHAVRRRRARALQVRRRQLLIIDIVIGLVLALVLIALAPGLAIVALVALLVLGGCAVWWLVAGVRERRREP